MKCTEAIITIAGYGTRLLPVTSVVPKPLLPIGKYPIVDYVVNHCIDAGITDIYLIVDPACSDMVRRFYSDKNERLERYLQSKGKTAELAELAELRLKATYHYIEQTDDLPYGTAVAIQLGTQYTKGQKVLALSGDQILYHADGSSEVKRFLEAAEVSSTASSMLTIDVPPDEVGKYGIVATEQRGSVDMFSYIIEKPAPGKAPSTRNNACCYMIDKDMLPYLNNYVQQPQSGASEYYFTDVLNNYVQAGHDLSVIAASAGCEYLDCGTEMGYMDAVARVRDVLRAKRQ